MGNLSWRQRVLLKLYRFITALDSWGQQIEASQLLIRAKRCGPGSRIWGRARITGIEHLEVGANVHIGDGAFVRAEGGVSIGDNTHISRNLLLYTVNHRYEGNRVPYDDQLVMRPVTIGRNVWIGMNVCIAPGTTIGDGAIVGMGTVVSGDVPPLAVIGNQKWRILRYRDRSRYEALDADEAYGGPNGVAFDLQTTTRKGAS